MVDKPYKPSGRYDQMPKRKTLNLAAQKYGKTSDIAWVTADKMEVAKALCNTGKTLCMNQNYRLWDNTRFLSIYANCDFMSPYAGNLGGTDSIPMPRMSYNVIKMCSDTLIGKLIQSNSRIAMLTTNADFQTQKKARNIELALEGEFNAMRLYPKAAVVGLSGINTGTGWLKLFIDDKHVRCEHVFPNEVFIDEMEAAYCEPTKIYQVRYIKKDTLLAQYPDKTDIIMKAPIVTPPRFAWTMFTTGLVEVWEGWALPQGNQSGRHTIAVASGSLWDEEWTAPYYPLVPFKPCDRPYGWYGQGYIEHTMATQVDLNKTLNVMQRAAHLGIAPYWVVDEGSTLNIKHLTNRTGHIVESNSGRDPKWVTNQPFHPDAVSYVKNLEQMIMTFYGMNEMETTGQLPINRLDSKKALRAYQDMAATRHTMLLERWEDFYVRVAQRTIILAQQIAKDNKGYPVIAKKDYQKTIQLDWKDLDIEEDAYTMQIATANLLSRQPAGRLQDIQDLADKGIVNGAQAAKLMRGPPDIDAVVNEISALDDNIDATIASIVDDNKYEPPNMYNVTPATMARMTNARLEYTTRKAPEEILGLFDRWMRDAKSVIKMMTPKQAPGQPPEQGMTDGTNSNPPAGSAGPGASPTGAPPGSPPPTPVGQPIGPVAGPTAPGRTAASASPT